MAHEAQLNRHKLLQLSLTALGVVYGDIGTSPLYALRECFVGPHRVPPIPLNVFGVLSLVFWSLIIVIAVKYFVYVMRADNRGEGGILALLALVSPERDDKHRRGQVLISLGLFGAALLYGDSMITPAISVLSAVEGLKVATPVLEPYVVPMTVVILVALFWFQKHGTARMGSVFGPVMLVWFATLAMLGVSGIARHPAVLRAVDPVYGVRFFLENGWSGFVVLGAVFLVVTGGEALYADMGHFGRKPIRAAWFTVVLPSLLLNYFGQGALLLVRPEDATEPFYHLAPGWALYPLVALATAATVIASQAVISGAFSLTRQAVLLGDCPRLSIAHTSAEEIGQIYIPAVNWALMVACVVLVVTFRSSSNLAAAYGVAVTTTMVITTILAGVLARRKWGWGLPAVFLVSALFLTIDVSFFAANLLKIFQGGWFPLAVGLAIYTLMSTWKQGRTLLAERMQKRTPPVEKLLDKIAREKPHRIPGTAVFMTSLATRTPPVLWHHLRHNRVLHERVILLTIRTEEIPWVPPAQRVEVQQLEKDFYRVVARCGFLEMPNVPRLLRSCEEQGLKVDVNRVTFYLGRETLIPRKELGMPLWRDRLFAFMARNAARATQFYRVPPEQVVELGMQIEI